jgi:hypothetical protein
MYKRPNLAFQVLSAHDTFQTAQQPPAYVQLPRQLLLQLQDQHKQHVSLAVLCYSEVVIPVHVQDWYVEVVGQVQGLKCAGLINHAILLQRLVHVELLELELAAVGGTCMASTRIPLLKSAQHTTTGGRAWHAMHAGMQSLLYLAQECKHV